MTGKRAGSRRGTPAPRTFNPAAAVLAVGVTLAVVAWGYLVWLAIDFGRSGRQGESGAWAFLALATLGAMACLFLALMLLVRLARTLGLIAADEPAPGPRPRTPGGRRAAR